MGQPVAEGSQSLWQCGERRDVGFLWTTCRSCMKGSCCECCLRSYQTGLTVSIKSLKKWLKSNHWVLSSCHFKETGGQEVPRTGISKEATEVLVWHLLHTRYLLKRKALISSSNFNTLLASGGGNLTKLIIIVGRE